MNTVSVEFGDHTYN